MINPTIFKSNDIRGIYPSELNEEVIYDIARSFVKYTGVKRVVAARDARVSADSLFSSLAKGMSHQSAEVYDIGQTPTECLYFAVGNYDFDAGIMITASHNPKEYNGLKMIKKNGDSIEIIRGKDLLLAMRESFVRPEGYPAPQDENEIFKKDIWKDYLNHILSFVDLSEITPLKIVIDASSGVAGKVISKIQDKLPVEIIPLNFEPDGNFPNHSPNPLAEGSTDQISERIKKEKADFGLIFDGDADRVFLIDEEGCFARGDITLLLIAKYFLQKNPGMAIAYNAICSKAVPEFIKKWNGVPIRTKVGFADVRAGLIENNGIMGGELSGHYCFKDNFYLDSGMIAFLTLLQVISKDGRNVSEIVKELSLYAKSAELNFKIKVPTASPSRILDEIGKKYSDGKQDYLDGVTVEYKNWWFNVRASNTEPLLRLTIEADTQELLKQKQKELSDFILK